MPAEALRAIEALADEARRSDAALEIRAAREEEGSFPFAAGLLRHMGAHGSSIAALVGLERALDDICERTAAESGHSVKLSHLSGWGIERALLYLRVVAGLGLGLAGAEEPARRLVKEAQARARLARGETSTMPFARLDVLVADIRPLLEALGRDIASRLSKS